MASAAARDSIASEYVTDYALTFETGVPALAAALGDGLAVREAIVELHLRLLDHGARHADRAQARRRRGGAGVGGRARGARRRRRAQPGGRQALQSFDASLREPGNALNPGHDRRPRDRDRSSSRWSRVCSDAVAPREPLLLIALSARMLADLARRDGQPVSRSTCSAISTCAREPRRDAPAA